MKENKKETTTITVLCIILVLALAICIFFLLTQTNKLNSANSLTQYKENNNQTNQDNKKEDDQQNNIANGSQDSTYSYNDFVSKLKTERAKYNTNNGYSQYEFVTYNHYTYGLQLDGEGHLYVQLDPTLKSAFNIGQDSYKIADYVLSFYVVPVSQGGGHDIYLVRDNGTVTKVNIDYSIHNKSILVEDNYHNLNNIVSVVSGTETDGIASTSIALFIDFNGTIHK